MGGSETVRKMSAPGGEHESGPIFCKTEEAVRRALALSPGKVLLLSDGALALSPFASPRTLSMVFDGDVISLFSMPDGVSRVLAAGDGETLLAARYFAEVRGIGCTLFPSDASLEGVREQKGEVLLSGKLVTVPLKEGETVCDVERMRPTFANAYARFLLERIAKIETDALNALKGTHLEIGELPEEIHSAEELIAFAFSRRGAEAEGEYGGEGVALSRLLADEPIPCWSACLMLSALYAAFFSKGKPRRYFTPDYRARAARAGTVYPCPSVPSPEEYASRALTLECIRAPFASRALAFCDERELQYSAMLRWSDRVPQRCGRTDILKLLPEHAPFGLSAVIRDFGLMDWDYDKRRTHTDN